MEPHFRCQRVFFVLGLRIGRIFARIGNLPLQLSRGEVDDMEVLRGDAQHRVGRAGVSCRRFWS